MNDFNKFQQEAIRTAVYPDVGWNLYYPALGLASEAGEVLWYISAIAYELNIPLDSIAEGVLKKLEDRRNRGVIQGSGDDR
jgi:NTP pyrophosphatase (non-canonical NTP hydrolase)